MLSNKIHKRPPRPAKDNAPANRSQKSPTIAAECYDGSYHQLVAMSFLQARSLGMTLIRGNLMKVGGKVS